MEKIIICRIDQRLNVNRETDQQPWTVRGLESAVGLSHQGLLNIRDGLAEPKLGTAYRIAYALGCEISDIWPPGQFLTHEQR